MLFQNAQFTCNKKFFCSSIHSVYNFDNCMNEKENFVRLIIRDKINEKLPIIACIIRHTISAIASAYRI